MKSFGLPRLCAFGLAMVGLMTTGVSSVRSAEIDPTQTVSIVSGGGFYQDLIYNYSTAVQSVSPVVNVDSDVPYNLPTGQWMGVFHYDYTAQRFTEAVYVLKENL